MFYIMKSLTAVDKVINIGWIAFLDDFTLSACHCIYNIRETKLVTEGEKLIIIHRSYTIL